MITQTRLKELLDYFDGTLVWRVSLNIKAQKGQTAGSVNAKGHVNVQVDKKMYALHQLVYLYHHGVIPDEIDHGTGTSSTTESRIFALVRRVKTRGTFNSCPLIRAGIGACRSMQEVRSGTHR